MINAQPTQSQRVWGTIMIVLGLALYAMPFVIGDPRSIGVFMATGTMLLVFGTLMFRGRLPSPHITQASTAIQQRCARVGGYALLAVGLWMIALPWVVGVPQAWLYCALGGGTQIVFGALMAAGKLR